MRAPPRPLEILALGPLPEGLREWLAPELEARLHAAARLPPPWPLHPAWWDAERKQYRSNPIVDTLVDSHPPSGWRLALLDADLYAPERRFVFGEATLGGCCALVGLARLRSPGDTAARHPLTRQRLLTEAVHELGHVAGLPHCANPGCVMTPSPDVVAVDAKDSHFCADCASEYRLSGASRRG